MKECDDSQRTSSQIWNLNWFLLHFKSFGREKSALECEACVPVCCPAPMDATVLCPSGPLLQHDIRGALPPAPQRLHHHPGHRPLHPHAQPLVLLLHVQVWTHMCSDVASCTGFPFTNWLQTSVVSKKEATAFGRTGRGRAVLNFSSLSGRFLTRVCSWWAKNEVPVFYLNTRPRVQMFTRTWRGLNSRTADSMVAAESGMKSSISGGQIRGYQAVRISMTWNDNKSFVLFVSQTQTTKNKREIQL